MVTGPNARGDLKRERCEYCVLEEETEAQLSRVIERREHPTDVSVLWIRCRAKQRTGHGAAQGEQFINTIESTTRCQSERSEQ